MTSNLAYAIATLLTWTGWIAVGRLLYLGTKLAFNTPGLDRKATQKGLLITSIIAALAFAAGAMMSTKEGAGLSLPLVWFVMPFSAWAAITSFIVAIARLAQGWLALNDSERNDRLKAAAIWGAAAIIFLAVFRRDPENKIEILRGSIAMSLQTALAILLIAAAGIIAMTLAAKWASGRGVSRTLVSQTALIAGSLVFGLPFAFLVITSFKEDRDMSSAEGIIWVPRVQDTVPYLNPKNPLYETEQEGTRIKAKIIERKPNGFVRLEVEEPRALGGRTFESTADKLKEIPRDANVVTGTVDGQTVKGFVVEDLESGGQRVKVMEPVAMKDQEHVFDAGKTEPVRHVGLRVKNYSEALSFLPPETNNGLVYLKNTLLIVIFSVIGTILSSSIVAYAFSRMKFPGRDALFMLLLSTMMLPAAVTMLPQFLIFRTLGWVDTLYPLWVPAFFASAFNVFLLRQFFMQIPMELEDASKIDGASYLKTFWSVMLPQIKPALAVIAIWTFMGAWNNFMGPLIYINSPENMPLSYALQLFQGDRGNEPGFLMAFATLTIIPVLLLFFFAQRYFIEGVTLSGMGGR
jgi:multiple sugar transport system permease protein